MADTNFNKRPRPGVRQRHNTGLEHRIVRNQKTPKPPKPVAAEGGGSKKTIKRREQRRRQKERTNELEYVQEQPPVSFALGVVLSPHHRLLEIAAEVNSEDNGVHET